MNEEAGTVTAVNGHPVVDSIPIPSTVDGKTIPSIRDITSVDIDQLDGDSIEQLQRVLRRLQRQTDDDDDVTDDVTGDAFRSTGFLIGVSTRFIERYEGAGIINYSR